ncbi:Fis family transcriptional regulator [Photobacterium swingsii]|uniref:Sigma-54-dependent Fis family transcriptional regulator n=1 Tax=Photobacterium swingsii TaxID=680026 RepID=A0A0J8VDU0_9GAMM|nr:sigma 54-interacting transcriptional regulator [Photobacterium swingsii]KMV31471.1 Fis family transcriptional regulator [Photobacterium swingsii]PSW25010.1 sigma-54-dependent Fis family transcriptional regulator [Photobacterium swingsii]
MQNTTSPSELMQLQPTILRFTQMLSAVLKIDAEVVDADLVRIAGTGPYSKFFGKKLNTSSRIFRYIIETNEEKVVVKSRTDPLCEGCNNKSSCREMAFLGVPIMIEERCLGVISLVAFTEDSRERIKDNVQLFSDYVKHIAQIVVSKVVERNSKNKGLDEVFTHLIENMDQGVLVLDENNRVKYGNQPALNNLNIKQDALYDHEIKIRSLSLHNNEIKSHQQHIISQGEWQKLIVGQFYNTQGQQLFLMAYHQPNSDFTIQDHGSLLSTVIGESAKMRQLKKMITRVASSPSSVLINGESGTGKEVIANAVHNLSDRSQSPFIAINCAAIPEALLESELFGYVKGAFTGASNKGKNGLIQAANKGTLFLDEIGDMPMTLQAKLLRVLEERKVMPIGSNDAVPVDIRIISATNHNFQEMIATNKFREDLYYRLNVIPFQLPPLREREGDIALLTNYFLEYHTQKIGVAYPGISAEAMRRLNVYHWPGNVRELSNLVEYLVNIVPEGDQIDIDLLPPHFEQSSEISSPEAAYNDDYSMSLEDMEKNRIEEAIHRLGNRKMVAEELGIGIATLYRKIKKYELNSHRAS